MSSAAAAGRASVVSPGERLISGHVCTCQEIRGPRAGRHRAGGAAFAAGQVACDGRTDFVRLHLAAGNPGDGSDTACFANAGAVGVDLSGVGRIDSGTTVVTAYWDGGRTDLGRWQGVDTNFGPARQVVIY